MLSVAIHKDIAEYQPKVIGKLIVNGISQSSMSCAHRRAPPSRNW